METVEYVDQQDKLDHPLKFLMTLQDELILLFV